MEEREYYNRVVAYRDTTAFSLRPQYPVNDLRIELSNICNHQCLFCANRKMTRKKGYIDEKFLKRILQQAYDEGFRGVGLYATGEPFMSKNLSQYVSWTKSMGYEYVYITSNGGVEFERIKEAIDAGLDSIKFSINGTDRNNYELIHGKDDFDQVIGNLKRTFEYKKSLIRKLNVFVSIAVTRFTEDSVERFIKEYKPYCDDIITATAIDMGGYVPEVNKYLKSGRHTEFHSGMSVPCNSLWNTFFITWEGYATACCADFQNYFIYADLNKESIREAWTNHIITELRRRHLEGNIENLPCKMCVQGIKDAWKPLKAEYATLCDESMFEDGQVQSRISRYVEKSKENA